MSNRPRSKETLREVAGIALAGFALLLFFSLLSYDVGDIPPWVPLISSASTPNEETHNLVGAVGAILGGYAYFFFGLASFLLAALLFGLGIGKLLLPGFHLRERLGWVVLNVICGACILQLHPGIFRDWEDYFRAHGTGGFIGFWLGERAFGKALGLLGSIIVLGVLYFSSLILATGFHPVRFCKECWLAWRSRVEAARLRRIAEMDEKALIEERRRDLEKKTRTLEKKLRKSKKTMADSEDAEPGGDSTDAFPSDVPEPKIIDASVPRASKSRAADSGDENPPHRPGALSALHLEDYQLPGLDLLDSHEETGAEPADPSALRHVQDLIIETLEQFGIEARPGDITKGPTITRYEIYPAKGVRVDRISALERDIARATKAERINILAPIPGKDTVGIELANPKKVKVILKELFESDAWSSNTKARLPIALGKDVYGNTIIGDLAAMPHCLVAGTTGSGKSVCINAIIASLLFRHSPEHLRFIMIDPKVVELQMFNRLPHLVTPVVTDPKKVLLALRWVVEEMEARYRFFAKAGVRNIAGFNSRPLPKTKAELDAETAAEEAAEPGEPDAISPEPGSGPLMQTASPTDAPSSESPEPVADPAALSGPDASETDREAPAISVPRDFEPPMPRRMPYIVVIVDELADLMQTAPADVEGAIARITQMARAAGIHMIVATQTPRADVVTGIIKANIPTRIAFQVASKIDSRVILDENGAEKLLGQGDMLYLPPGTSKFTRSQGVLVTDEEMKRIVDFVAAQGEPAFEDSIHERLQGETTDEDVTEEDEALVEKCLEIIKQERKASTSMLQRRLRLGYTRAARVVDILEMRGILGPKDGAKDREILVDIDSL